MSVTIKRAPHVRSVSTFDIKSADLSLVALMVKTGDWGALAADLECRFGAQGESPRFFDHDALVIDVSQLPPGAPVQDFAPLLAVLRSCCLVPVALRGGDAQWTAAAQAAGLADASVQDTRERPETTLPAEVVVQEVVREVVHERPAPTTLIIDKPLRSGQRVYARGTDLVVLAMVNQGAEIVADGNIHVYAPLRGRAMAGAAGNASARIFSLCMEPELVSIAGIYRTSETPLPVGVHGRPAQVRLSNDGRDKMLIEPLNP